MLEIVWVVRHADAVGHRVEPHFSDGFEAVLIGTEEGRMELVALDVPPEWQEKASESSMRVAVVIMELLWRNVSAPWNQAEELDHVDGPFIRCRAVVIGREYEPSCQALARKAGSSDWSLPVAIAKQKLAERVPSVF
jgi:hypothetical protein